MTSASAFRRSLGTSTSRLACFPELGPYDAVTGMELQGVGIECIRGWG